MNRITRSLLIFSSTALLGTALAVQAESPEYWTASGKQAVELARQMNANERPAKNVILFVGDGMGVSTVTAARILEGQLRGESGEENSLSFEKLPYLALSKTYSVNQQTPDSAPTMTAMVTGVKTNDGLISVNEYVARNDYTAVEGNTLETLVEQAEQRGLSTGVVSTARLTHATPAATYAHSPNRDWESDRNLPSNARTAGFPDIARQLIEFNHGDGLEVALGGGRAKFLPADVADPEDAGRNGERLDGRNLPQEWQDRLDNSNYVWNKAQFDAINPNTTDHLLGLFERSHMEYEADRANDTAGEPSLTDMTDKAIDILSRNKRGYVLVVEAGRIDHSHHAGNAYRALNDTIELSDAVRLAMQKTDPKDTLIVVTADHSHVFTIAGYPERGNDILGKVVTPSTPTNEYAHDALGLPYTTLGYQNGPGYTGASAEQAEGVKHAPHFGSGYVGITAGRPDLGNVDTSHPDYLQEAAIPLSSETHSGEDVAIYAGGPMAHLFHGVQEQHVIYHVLATALGFDKQ